MTTSYLELISTYVSLMILLSKVDDRKTVLGLYTIAHEIVNGQGDPGFPRLGQMIVDYEAPMKKLSEDFVPHSKLIYEALQSLVHVYKGKNATADELRRTLRLNLSASPNLMLQPPFPETVTINEFECFMKKKFLKKNFFSTLGRFIYLNDAESIFKKLLE